MSSCVSLRLVILYLENYVDRRCFSNDIKYHIIDSNFKKSIIAKKYDIEIIENVLPYV